LLVRAVGTEITGYCAVVVESDPLGLLVQPIADGDLKVSDFPIVDLVPFGRMIEGLLVMEDPLFEVVEAIFVTFGGHTSTGFSVSDGLERPLAMVRNMVLSMLVLDWRVVWTVRGESGIGVEEPRRGGSWMGASSGDSFEAL
jgi:hypothetical protein